MVVGLSGSTQESQASAYRAACWARGLYPLGTKILWFSAASAGGEDAVGWAPQHQISEGMWYRV